MPVKRRSIRRRNDYVGTLDCVLEMSLLTGTSGIGLSLDLRCLADWQRLWARWRSVILPKSLEHRPGLRPFASYVVGEIPRRPVLVEPPEQNAFVHVWVPDHHGAGVWHHDMREPYMQSEADYLRGLGVVTAEEYARYRAWGRRRNAECSSCWANTYPQECEVNR